MFTNSEKDAIRFYEGDIRKREDDGKLSETEQNSGFWGIPSAYRTINCLMFDDISNEQERIKEKKGKLVPELYIEIEKVIGVYRDIFSAMFKYSARKEKKGKRIVFRTERGVSANELKKGYSLSFMSTSKEDNPEEFLKQKTELTLFQFILPSEIPQLDFEEVLGSEYLFSGQKEILLPPFLELEFEEVELSEKEKAYCDANNQPPQGKYLVFIKGIRSTYSEAENFKKAELTPERNRKAADILGKLINNESITEEEKEEYCLWKKDVRVYLWEEFDRVKKLYSLEEEKFQKQELMSDIDKMMRDFNEKRKKYREKIRYYSIALAVSNTIPLACIALSFVDAIQVIMKILAVITSTISIFLSQMLRVEVYDIKLIQRTKTYLNLRELYRELKYEADWNDEKAKRYIRRFQEIMHEDTEMSLNNLKMQVKNAEKMFRDEISKEIGSY